MPFFLIWLNQMSINGEESISNLEGPRKWLSLGGGRCAILPSLLLCDFANLQSEVRRLEAAGIAALHLDVMDGQFVPNLTYGLPLVRAIGRITDLPLDVHLMIDRPERYIGAFRDAGADGLTIHVEATADPASVLREVRSVGATAGLAFNPPTPVEAVESFVDLCDVVLVMSVMPGFGGQEFDRTALAKLRALAERPGRTYCLQVDGGINAQTIGETAAAGADMFVVGSAICRHDDYAAQCRKLQSLAENK